MANKTIDDFTAVATPATTDTLLVTQSGVAKKETLAQIDTLLSATTKTLTNKTLTTPLIDTINEATATHGVIIDDLTIKDAGFALGSDADGDTYYRASGALARLAKGTANFKQFMNAAGTAPEWAKGVVFINFTRDLAAVSGDVAYTGVGFKPGIVIFFSGEGAAYGASFGADIGSARYGISQTAAGTWGGSAFSIDFNTAGGRHTGIIKTMDADGFTITWTKTSSPTGTGTILAACFR